MKKALLFLCNVTFFSFASESNEFLAIGQRPLHSYSYYSAKNKRTTQEDTCSIGSFKEGDFFAICDGHKGKGASQYLMNNFPTLFCAALHTSTTKREAFLSTVSKLEKDILKRYEEGSTIVIAHIDNKLNKLFLGWLGDSRAVLEHNGTVFFATTDHNFNDKKEEERVIRENGIIFRERLKNNLNTCGAWRINGLNKSRVFGDKFGKGKDSSQPDIIVQNPNNVYEVKDLHLFKSMTHKPYTIYSENNVLLEKFCVKPLPNQIIAIPECEEITLTEDHHCLVLGSAGLYFSLSNQEIIDFIIKAAGVAPSHDIAQYLVEAAIMKGSTNNITALLIDLRKD